MTVVKPDPTGVTISGPAAVVVGQTGTYTAAVDPSLALQGVTWSTSDAAIATITSAGVLTGVAAGTIKVRATSVKTSVYSEMDVTISAPDPESITVSGDAEVTVSNSATYTAAVLPVIASQAVTWSTSDAAKATITSAGVLTAVGAGAVEVIATSVAKGTVVGRLNITIVAGAPTIEFALNGGEWSITSLDQFMTGEATETPLGFYNPTNSEYLSVYTSNIFVTKNGGKFAPSKWVTRVGINKNSTGLYEVAAFLVAGADVQDMSGFDYMLFAHDGYATGYAFLGKMAVGQLVTMTGFDMPSASDGSITGTLKIYAAGAGTIGATATMAVDAVLPVPSKDGFTFAGWFAASDFSGTAVTTVAESVKLYAKWDEIVYPVSEITLEGPSTATMGLTSIFTAIIGPENATNKEVVWTTSDETVATISDEGVLTPVAEGTVVVSATASDNATILATQEVVVYGAPSGISFRGPTKFVVGGLGSIYAQVYTNGINADQTAVTYASADETKVTVASDGSLVALAEGDVVITITSTVDPTKSKTQTVNVYSETAAATEFTTSSVVVAAGKADKESIYYNYTTLVMGYNAFPTLQAAMDVVADDAIVYILEGTYPDAATVAKNNVTMSGDGTITGTISVAANVKGLTIDGLNFTGAGNVELAVAGGVDDFTFKNNYIYDSSAATALIYFANDGTALNKNISIMYNTFEVIDSTAAIRHIRGGNVENLTIIGNSFEGVMVDYKDAIRIEGTNSSATAGTGVMGILRIEDNTFENIGQRGIWIRRYATTQTDILNNVFNQCGDQTYGGGVQFENWVSGQTTAINFMFNIMENMYGSFGLRLNNAAIAADATWSATVHYNQFIDFIVADGVVIDAGLWDNIVQTYSETSNILINADYNLFWRDGFVFVPGEDEMPFVGSYTNQFTYKEDLELAAKIAFADPTYGVEVYNADLETETKWSSYPTTDTDKTLGGIEWTLQQTLLNPDTNDKLNATADQGSMMLRFRGANTAYMYTADFVNGLTTLTFDAKYYSSSHSTSVMTVSKMKDGETEWTKVADITLTDAYVKQIVAINETGAVKVRFDVTTKSANIDNIKFYQSAVVFADQYYATAAPDATGFFVYPALAAYTPGDRVIYNGESYYFGTNAVVSLSDLEGKLVANETVILGPGTIAGNLTIDKEDVSLLGQNALINANAAVRNTESVLTGTITIAKELKDITIAGVKFTGMAQILNTAGTAGTASVVATNLDGFVFANNIVETDLESGDAFLKFVESGSSYSHDLSFINNYFTTTNALTTLANVIRIDNNAGLIVTGNVFENVVNGAFFVNDTTKGLAGNTLISENTFENIGNGAILLNWLSALPSTTMGVDVTKNIFTNVGGIALKVGKMNNSDILDHIFVKENTFTDCNACMWFVRVHAAANIHVNLNVFNTIPTAYYITDELTAATPVTLDAKDNIYKNNGVYITPEASKFVGAPDYSTSFVTIPVTFNVNGGSEIPVQNVLKDELAGKPTDPTKGGYEFGGWYTDEAFENAFDFNATIIAEATTLYAKWSIATLTITYNLNDGYWKYASKEAMLTDFLTDLYAFVGATESITDFMHGTGKTSGFDGLWHSNTTYKAKIYAGTRPTEANAASGMFIDAPAYFDKWISFFDNLEAFVVSVNATQHLYGGTWTGFLRMKTYFIGTIDATYTAERQAMVPYYGSPKTFTIETPEITINTPLKAGYVFGGWYNNAEFTGDAVTAIALGTSSNVVLYAKWAPVV
ncbi:MAG: InlB B-repeat-containing protein [Dehalococcoidales bacterium]